MSEGRKKQDYYKKAVLYDLMANYYKYLDPNRHVNYYKKHLKYVSKALQSERNQTSQSQPHARIRFLHVSPDAPNIDIYLNARLIVKNLPFKEVSNYLSLPPGKYHLDIYPTENLVSTVLSKKITVESEKIYTLPFIGMENKHRVLSFEDQPHVPPGETKARFIHLSANTPALDLAVVKGDVVFPNITYKQPTHYLGLSPMTVNLEIRESGTKHIIYSLPSLQFKPNERYSIIALGLMNGEPPLEVIVLNG